MLHSAEIGPDQDSLAEGLLAQTGESVFRCYQCGKCTAGCPLAAEMDFGPNQVVRLLQMEIPDADRQALRALAIWLCLTCEQCSARCPQQVDLSRIMDYLRQQSRRRDLVHPDASDVLAFHQAFLNTIRHSGRLHEIGLIARYKLKTLHLMQDVQSVPALLKRGKLKLLPHASPDRAAVRRIFDRCTTDARADTENQP